MTGPPPCLWSAPCLYDDETGTCPCDDDQPEDEPPPRPVVDVPVGHYL
ncbi:MULTISPECIES: hypothetical protein [Streptomyces]|nr:MULTISPECIES: hypothetical protein [Streptomyces]MBT3077597.1 hypothetical protein [Streptomyces sp. COG21]MBT3084442.1 hypothetical protein [Streptomyces sp. COG20]MBT3085349.1 hypothetical protein [Streptomyces sp. CYG21]MBT3095931.1 hypothetical protein [Streptomyces sp. CBG30]MBT3100250.1 hypothetical protein [Streptomyces sp. CBG30]